MAVRYVRNVSRTEAGKASRFAYADCITNTACELPSILGQSGLEFLCAGKMLAHSRSGNHPCSPVWKTIDGGSLVRNAETSSGQICGMRNFFKYGKPPFVRIFFRLGVEPLTKRDCVLFYQVADLIHYLAGKRVNN